MAGQEVENQPQAAVCYVRKSSGVCEDACESKDLNLHWPQMWVGNCIFSRSAFSPMFHRGCHQTPPLPVSLKPTLTLQLSTLSK